MIKPRSLSKPYTLIWSRDPALELPVDEKQREEALRIARETNKWEALIRQGEEPTLFQVRPMPGTARAWLIGEQARGQREWGEVFELALRLVLVQVDNFGDFKVKHDAPNEDGFKLVSRSCIDALYAIDRDLVEELGAIVFLHATEGISPLA